MKKLVFTAILIIGSLYSASAQDISEHAIGIRTGDNDGFGYAISYQRKMKDINRFEVDLGFRDNKNFDAWKLTGLYQWVWNIDGGFNWYAGFGAGIGTYNNKFNNDDDGLFVNADGNIGIEYNFEIPLLISIDFRPEFGIINGFGDNDLDLDIALGIRYQF
jgi:opacity protein-like surface antigen